MIVDSSHRKSGRKTLRKFLIYSSEDEGMKCWQVNSIQLELHDSSRQKLTHLTGSQIVRIFQYISVYASEGEGMKCRRVDLTRVA